MPIPPFNISGVLPPYIGPDGPGGAHAHMSPYGTNPVEVVQALSSTPGRCDILDGWLAHRAALRALGLSGFQWIDGSFVERKDPGDVDVVTFFRRPPQVDAQGMHTLALQNSAVFSRTPVKQTYHVDAMFVELDGTPETIVELTRYWVGLFSHRRGDDLWKGMLKVSLTDSGDDATASRMVAQVRAVLVVPVVGP